MCTMAATAPAKHLITVEEWDRLIALGFFEPEARIELIEGEMIDMPPIGDDHIYCVNALNQLLMRSVGDAAIVQVQSPIRLSRLSDPEPDVALLRPPLTRYRSRRATPEDILLVIEVSDTSLGYDQGRKGPLYALAGIPEYWIVDLNTQQVLVARDPGPDGYRSIASVGAGEMLTPGLLPDLSIPASTALGLG